MNMFVTPCRNRARAAAAAAVAVLALSLTACGESAGSTVDGITLIKAGKLTVCAKLPYRPFEFKEGDKIVGFDVDLMDLLAKDMNVQQEIVDIGLKQIWSGAAFAPRSATSVPRALPSPRRGRRRLHSPRPTLNPLRR